MHWRDICHSEEYVADCDSIRPQIGRFDELCRAIEIAVATKPESYPIAAGSEIRVGSTRSTLGGDQFPDVEDVWFAFRALDDNRIELLAMTLAPEMPEDS